ncbi:MAG: hypothetical protein ACI8RD_010716, partial [Bacillariaceae sp.]
PHANILTNVEILPIIASIRMVITHAKLQREKSQKWCAAYYTTTNLLTK